MTATERVRVLVLFGGRSAEHEISCLSARSVLAALDPERYVVTTVGITRDGRWTLVDGVPDTPAGVLPSVPEDGDTVALVQTRKGPRLVRFGDTFEGIEIGPVDVCFPVLHGPYGEDGTVQGLLASYQIPYVGADVASSAVGIDKRQMKNVFKARGLPQVPYETIRRSVWDADREAVVRSLESALRFPMFTKPARQGSSIGIHLCRDREALLAGIEDAFTYGRVVIVEQGLQRPREIECGVIGNVETELEVTPPGEVRTEHEFYDFEGKYLDDSLQLQCPADVPDDIVQTCRAYAREAYLSIGARGMARVDFFYLPESGQVLVNEINTIPGFTPVSMFPYVWQTQGLTYPQLIDRLLQLALEAGAAEGLHGP
ncbi:MAG TPA: D-alanine--D-alanine ligase family protein [Egibacteraceae bacterium]|nr:D-alanine--D-alanine ligase family protein [Egibacteraceae bacterium]